MDETNGKEEEEEEEETVMSNGDENARNEAKQSETSGERTLLFFW